MNFKTKYSEITWDDLIKMDFTNEQVKSEWLLRVIKNGSGSNSDKTKALRICREDLRKTPNNNFYNFLMGINEKNLSLKKELLMKAVSPKGSFTDIIADASLALAKVFFNNEEYFEGMIWLTNAMLHGSGEAVAHFLNADLMPLDRVVNIPNKFTSNENNFYPVWSLALSAYVAIDCKKKYFAQKNLMKYEFVKCWQNHLAVSPVDFVRNNELHCNTDAGLESRGMPIFYIAKYAFSLDPFVFHDFFDYCDQYNIISTEILRDLLNFQLEIIKTFNVQLANKIKDKIYYSLFISYLKEKKLAEAYRNLDLISDQFTNYKIIDLINLGFDIEQCDTINYEVFKKLVAQNNFMTAGNFFNQLNHFFVCDKDMFKFLDSINSESSSEALKYKQQVTNRILTSKHELFTNNFLTRVIEEDKKLNQPNLQINVELKGLLSLFETEMEEKEIKKNDNLFFKGDATKIAFVKQLRESINQKAETQAEYESIIRTLQQLLTTNEELFLGKKFGAALNTATKKFPKQLGILFLTAEEKLIAIKNLIQTMNVISSFQSKDIQPIARNLTTVETKTTINAYHPLPAPTVETAYPQLYPQVVVTSDGIPIFYPPYFAYYDAASAQINIPSISMPQVNAPTAPALIPPVLITDEIHPNAISEVPNLISETPPKVISKKHPDWLIDFDEEIISSVSKVQNQTKEFKASNAPEIIAPERQSTLKPAPVYKNNSLPFFKDAKKIEKTKTTNQDEKEKKSIRKERRAELAM